MYGAISVYDPVSGKMLSLSDLHPQLSKGVHNSFAEDASGNVWDASSHGLFIFNQSDSISDTPFRRITPNEGLSDIYVSTVVFDTAGNAWVGTHDGLTEWILT